LIDNNGREAVKCAQTDSNQAEDICPARFFAPSEPANHRINVAGKKKGRTMNPLTQSKNATILPVLIALTLGCFALAPQARADCREGCDSLGNTFLGENALFNNTFGDLNTAVGDSALGFNTTGNSNTAIGHSALLNNTSGGSNIALGDSAGINLTTTSNNIDIGNKGVAGDTGKIRIGKKPTHTATFIQGISGVTVAGGVGVLINTSGQLGTIQSSARVKDEIKPMDKASEAILALQPVTFRYKHDLDPDGIPQFGLVAEQVEKVNADLVAHDEAGKPYTVRYEAVNAMLLNEFLKAHAKIEEQERKVQELEATIAQLRASAAQEQELQATVAGLQSALKEQASRIQKVSDQLRTQASAPRVVADNLTLVAPINRSHSQTR
jgi:hypothetical protein